MASAGNSPPNSPRLCIAEKSRFVWTRFAWTLSLWKQSRHFPEMFNPVSGLKHKMKSKHSLDHIFLNSLFLFFVLWSSDLAISDLKFRLSMSKTLQIPWTRLIRPLSRKKKENCKAAQVEFAAKKRTTTCRQCSLRSSYLPVGCPYFRRELYLPRLLPFHLLLCLHCFYVIFWCVLCLQQLKYHAKIIWNYVCFLLKSTTFWVLL